MRILSTFLFDIPNSLANSSDEYVKSLKTLLLTIISINFANISFALGGLLTLIGLKKLLVNKIYPLSRQN